MSARHDEEPQTRRERLAVIAEEYTECIGDHRTRDLQLGDGPVPRFAAVTSAGPRETAFAEKTELILAGSAAELAELLRQECEEGRLAYWRVWDLDEPWDSLGNLEILPRFGVGSGGSRSIHTVTVEAREDGTYLFEDPLDAEAFVKAVRRQGGEAELAENPLHDRQAAERLLDAEGRHQVRYDPRAYCPECRAAAKAGSRNRISTTHCEYECPGGHGFFSLREPVIAVTDGGR